MATPQFGEYVHEDPQDQDPLIPHIPETPPEELSDDYDGQLNRQALAQFVSRPFETQVLHALARHSFALTSTSAFSLALSDEGVSVADAVFCDCGEVVRMFTTYRSLCETN